MRLTAGVRGHIGTVKLLQLHSHTSPFENVTFFGFCEQFGVLSRKNSVVLMKLAGLGQYVIGSAGFVGCPFFKLDFD